MKTHNMITSLVLSLGLIGIAPGAFAEHLGESVYGSPGYRDGFTFGLAIGGGDLRCSGDGCDSFTEAGSFDLHLGGMVQSDLAVIFDAWWMVHDEGRFSVNQGIYAAAVQYWPIQYLWLRGGLGLARASYSYDGSTFDVEDHSELVPAFTLAIGVEPIATDTFGLDIQLKYGTGFYSDGDTRIHNIALALGISFY